MAREIEIETILIIAEVGGLVLRAAFKNKADCADDTE
jgi:hypothetical protein